MSCTTSSNPAFTRLSAIGPPILPSPINPTLPAISFLPSVERIVALADGKSRSLRAGMAVSGTNLSPVLQLMRRPVWGGYSRTGVDKHDDTGDGGWSRPPVTAPRILFVVAA